MGDAVSKKGWGGWATICNIKENIEVLGATSINDILSNGISINYLAAYKIIGELKILETNFKLADIINFYCIFF